MRLRRSYESSPRLRRWIRRRKGQAVYGMARLALALPRPLPFGTALAVADRIGDLAYWILRETRRLALEHVTLALGETHSPQAREEIVRASFRNIARCFCELAKFEEIRAHLDSYVDVEGWEHVEEVLAGGQGAIAVTGHIGNWELLAAYFGNKGFPVGAIARRMQDSQLNDLIVDFRARNGVETILRESPSAGRQILKVLKGKGMLAMLIDQDTRAPSVSVPFFGQLARTPVAAAALALRRNLPAVPVFARRRPEGGHRLTVLPPIYPPNTGDRDRDILQLTGTFSKILEDWIRNNPVEWVWWHRRWRRPPDPQLDLDREIPYSSSNSVLF
jgi:KDO2-lipid IV(A) lauroyltransferase